MSSKPTPGRLGRLEMLKVYLPGILLAVLALGIAWHYVEPAPPSTMVLATGPEGSSYDWLGQRYAEVLKKQGLIVTLIPSQGVEESLRLISEGKADAAFIQGGAKSKDPDAKFSFLASLYYQPLWLFTLNESSTDDLMQLKGKKIGVGAIGSQSEILGTEVLKGSGLDELNELSEDNSLPALLSGETDLAILVGSPDSPQVREMLGSDKVHLTSLRRADGYTKRFLHLSHLVLHEGSIDLAKNLPSARTDVLACSANLVVGEGFHPALAGVVLSAAKEIHSAPGALQGPGDFPSAEFGSYPITREAKFFHENGPTFLQGLLPYQIASTVERVIILVLPLLTIVLPLCKILPAVYAWRMKAKIYQPYRELLLIESQIDTEEAATLLEKLETLESNSKSLLSMPASYASEIQQLRIHIRRIKNQVLESSINQEPAD